MPNRYLLLIGYIRVIRAVAAAGVGVEDGQRFNFGHSADCLRPQLQAKEKL